MHPLKILVPVLASLMGVLMSVSMAQEIVPSPESASELPKVLIMGDSISLGYTPLVKKLLVGKAEVIHHKGNAGPTIRGIKQIDSWLGDTKWDVIHFNFGLWDMYGWEYVKENRSPAMYEKRLETLVLRLEKTGAKLIWATTTPSCPAPEFSMQKRFNSDVIIAPALEKQYLDAALRVMKKHKIPINDLHALIKPTLKQHAVAPNNVHFKPAGREKLAKQVAKQILQHQ
jgi:lysophospholipase L1-like esterase